FYFFLHCIYCLICQCVSSVIVDDVFNALTKVNLCNAKSIVVATDNEMANLEIGLIAHTKNPDSKLILRTFDPRFSENLAKLLPNSEVLCVYSLAAEVFAAAAFGNNVLNLFRLNDQTILVAEYNIQSRDSLCGLLLAEVAYGYGIILIIYRKYLENYTELMPSDDTRLKEGDRLVVVETIESLQRIERGEMLPRCWQVQVNTDLTGNSVFEGARAISRVSGCDIKIATELMNNLPGVIQTPMYKHQAQRLVRELSKLQCLSQIIPYST
ncbi:MAG: NAD-binding protein, partial [Rhizonema sp. PD38]|nr:NAD-binding protein [Rhizonema sp. PD38]